MRSDYLNQNSQKTGNYKKKTLLVNADITLTEANITIGAGSAIVSLVMKDPGGNASNSTAGTQVSNIVIGTSAQRGDYVNMTFFGGEWVADCMSSINNAVITS